VVEKVEGDSVHYIARRGNTTSKGYMGISQMGGPCDDGDAADPTL